MSTLALCAITAHMLRVPAAACNNSFIPTIMVQDAWFDDTDESDSVESPQRGSPQKWKVHEGLGAADSAGHGYVNAAFVDD